jgi:hypothetical protein
VGCLLPLAYGQTPVAEITPAGYVVAKRTKLKGRIYQHRVIANAPKGMIVHHKNGDKSDNRNGNLELMTQSQHCREHKPHEARWGKQYLKYTHCIECGTGGKLRKGLCNRHYLRKWRAKSRYGCL